MPGAIAKAWEEYRTGVLPKNAPPIQVMETRRAFYAGAQCFFAATLEFSDQDTPDERGVDALEAMNQELQGFARDVVEGRRDRGCRVGHLIWTTGGAADDHDTVPSGTNRT